MHHTICYALQIGPNFLYLEQTNYAGKSLALLLFCTGGIDGIDCKSDCKSWLVYICYELRWLMICCPNPSITLCS